MCCHIFTTVNRRAFSLLITFVQVKVTESSGRMDENPRMKITENNTLIDISVNLAKVPGVWVLQPAIVHIGTSYHSKSNLESSDERSIF